MVDILKGEQFPPRSRGRHPIDRIIFHEPAVATLDGTIRTLKAKNLSVHYTVDRAGTIRQHLGEEHQAIHAGMRNNPTNHNPRSIAIEVINRYYGHRLPQVANLPEYKDAEVVSGIWVDRAWNATQQKFLNPNRLYIFPTPEQLEATWELTHDILHRHPVIAQAGWTGRGRTITGAPVYKWSTVQGHDGPGVKAHAQWAHADGRVPDYYCLLRNNGLTAQAAFQQTLSDSTRMERQTPLFDKPSWLKW